MNYTLDIQYFAEDNKEGTDGSSYDNAPVITFDELLTDKTYQSEFDKRMTKGIETAKEKMENELKELREYKEKFEKVNEEYTEYKNTTTEEQNELNKQKAIEVAVAKSGTLDDVSVKAHLSEFIADAEVDEKGNVKGIDEKISELKKSHNFLFDAKPKKSTGFELGKGDIKNTKDQMDIDSAFGVKSNK